MVDAIIELESSFISPPLCDGISFVADEDQTDAGNARIRDNQAYVDFSVTTDFQQEMCYLLSRMNVHCVADVINYTVIDFHQDDTSRIITQSTVSFSREGKSYLHVQTPDASPDDFFSVDLFLHDCEWSLPVEDDEVTSHAMAYALRSVVPIAPVRNLWQLILDDFQRDVDGNTLLLKDPLRVPFRMDTNSHELKLYSGTFGNRLLKSYKTSVDSSSRMSLGNSIQSIQHDPVLIALLCLLAIMAVIFFDVMIFFMETPSPKVGTYPFLLGYIRHCVLFSWYSIKLYGKVGWNVLRSLMFCVMDVVTFVRFVVYKSICILGMVRVLPSVIWIKIKFGLGYVSILGSYSCSVNLKFPFRCGLGKRLLVTVMQSVVCVQRCLQSGFHLFLSMQYLIASKIVCNVTKLVVCIITFLARCLSLVMKAPLWILSKIMSVVTFPLRLFVKRSLRADSSLGTSKCWMTPQCKESPPSYCPSICPVTFYKPRSDKSTCNGSHLDDTTERTRSPGSLKGIALFQDDVDSSSPCAEKSDESNNMKSPPSQIRSGSIRDIRDEHLLRYERHLHSSVLDHLDQHGSDNITPPSTPFKSTDGEKKRNPIETTGMNVFQCDKVFNSCEDEKDVGDQCEQNFKQDNNCLESQEESNLSVSEGFTNGKDGDTAEKSVELCNTSGQSKVEPNLSSNTTMASTCLHADVLENEIEVGETTVNNTKNADRAEDNNSIQRSGEFLVEASVTKIPKPTLVREQNCSVNFECEEMAKSVCTRNLEQNFTDCSESSSDRKAEFKLTDVLDSNDMKDSSATEMPKSILARGRDSGVNFEIYDMDESIFTNNLQQNVPVGYKSSQNLEADLELSDVLDSNDREDPLAKPIPLNNVDSATNEAVQIKDTFCDSLDRRYLDESNVNDVKCQEQCAESYESEFAAMSDDYVQNSVEDRDSAINAQIQIGSKPVHLHPGEQDCDHRNDNQFINHCDLLTCSDVAINNLGRFPSTLGTKKPSTSRTSSNLDSMSNAQSIRATKDFTVNSESITFHTKSDDEITPQAHQSIKTVLMLNATCEESASQEIENINSSENSLQTKQVRGNLTASEFQSIQQELVAKLKLRGRQMDDMEVVDHTQSFSSSRNLSPCSKLQKTWELSAEMKGKPKKLKTPDIFLSNKSRKNNPVSTNMRIRKGRTKNNVSQLVAQWSKDPISPSQGSVGATEPEFGNASVTNKIENGFRHEETVRLSKSKKIRPFQTYNDSSDDTSTLHVESPLSFLNDMMG